MNTPFKSQLGTVFIHVKDLKKSVEWYSNILGFCFDPTEIESPVYNIPIDGTTGLTLDEHKFDKSFKCEPSPNPICNLLVGDIDEAYNFMKSNGVEIVREIERIRKDFAWFNFVDLDGNVLMACTC
ncbi:VOC family protein [Virgibacillus sp. DJP39]|uniref:VOC family protein n=1 Tax=Virgibacillus sp. DJP39 TaxID=3409790 RepID=UPI003BB52175